MALSTEEIAIALAAIGGRLLIIDRYLAALDNLNPSDDGLPSYVVHAHAHVFTTLEMVARSTELLEDAARRAFEDAEVDGECS